MFACSPHYRDKQDVAKRLAVGATHRVYGDQNLVSDGPYPVAIYHTSASEVTVEYAPVQYLVLLDTPSFQVPSEFFSPIFIYLGCIDAGYPLSFFFSVFRVSSFF